MLTADEMQQEIDRLKLKVTSLQKALEWSREDPAAWNAHQAEIQRRWDAIVDAFETQIPEHLHNAFDRLDSILNGPEQPAFCAFCNHRASTMVEIRAHIVECDKRPMNAKRAGT